MKSPPKVPTARDILAELESLGSERYKKLLITNHGVPEPCFGVKIGDMKPIQKRIGKNYDLALELYDSGNYDAMYFAGLIVDDTRMTRQDLQRWANQGFAAALPAATVAATAAGGEHGWQMGLKWIDSSKPHVATAGWSTLAAWVATRDDSLLELQSLASLLGRVEKEIHSAPDVVRYAMNSFVISVGASVKALTDLAIKTGERIGTISANLGNNACAIPFAPDYIRKIAARGAIGKKRKSAKC